MQAAILSQLSCSLVPHSTRPFWHQWENDELPKSPKNTARRRLFREEADQEENNKEFVQRLLAELADRYKQKWNFDFDNGRPMQGADHQFQYEAVKANQVPGFYRISTIFGQIQPKNGQQERNENEWEEEEDGKLNAQIGAETKAKEEGIEPTMKLKSPSRILAKPKRRTTNQTPKRNNWAAEEEEERQQSKMTDFVNVRKGLGRSGAKKEGNGADGILGDSPKRRRHSLCLPISMQISSPIKKASADFHRAQRRSQRIFHARQMLFK